MTWVPGEASAWVTRQSKLLAPVNVTQVVRVNVAVALICATMVAFCPKLLAQPVVSSGCGHNSPLNGLTPRCCIAPHHQSALILPTIPASPLFDVVHRASLDDVSTAVIALFASRPAQESTDPPSVRPLRI